MMMMTMTMTIVLVCIALTTTASNEKHHYPNAMWFVGVRVSAMGTYTKESTALGKTQTQVRPRAYSLSAV